MELGRELGAGNHGRACSFAAQQSEKDMDLRRGPWTVEEDLILVNYIANHGEGRWNSLARSAGLKRTGKSCRLRWLNYLRPDVRRGNITPEEQLLILELHSRWGNRWSKIAQHLPGRTDNEIKNYWRTRVQKHAKQLKCDVNSKQFKDLMRYLWMPRLLERIRAANSNANSTTPTASACHTSLSTPMAVAEMPTEPTSELTQLKPSPESSSIACSSSDSLGTQLSELYYMQSSEDKTGDAIEAVQPSAGWPESLLSPSGYGHPWFPDFEQQSGWASGDVYEGLWNEEDAWLLTAVNLEREETGIC